MKDCFGAEPIHICIMENPKSRMAAGPEPRTYSKGVCRNFHLQKLYCRSLNRHISVPLADIIRYSRFGYGYPLSYFINLRSLSHLIWSQRSKVQLSNFLQPSKETGKFDNRFCILFLGFAMPFWLAFGGAKASL